ncbi:GGDEF domain-containing protein [Gilvimarinus agarilyticus]|uniref:GGDEF domain-containing protein n=1 Tax=Gilvimarinus agarilyticus TaxID=679259 RepID=UPI00069608B8|nr:GGDEF domain-containing protein [Gilvimarinus agarilyticus]
MSDAHDLLLDMIAALPDPAFVLTESGRYAAILGGHDRQYYHDGSHLVDFALQDVLTREKADWFLQEIRLTLEQNCLRIVEYSLAGRDVDGLPIDTGPTGDIWFEGRIQPLPNQINGERAVVWVASNITERHNLQGQLQILSETDELTGRYNRRKLLAELAQHFSEFQRYQTPLALMIFDIDYFKRINDQHGHLFGDHVLHELAQQCQTQLRSADILGRFGGEEFAVVLPSTQLNSALQLAERLRHHCQQLTFTGPAGTAQITISIGVGTASGIDTTFTDLLRRADDALYSAKHAGRNCVQHQSDDTGSKPTVLL